MTHKTANRIATITANVVAALVAIAIVAPVVWIMATRGDITGAAGIAAAALIVWKAV